MARLVLHGVVLLVILGSTQTAHAQADVPDDVAAVADQAGVDALDLLGAMYSTHLAPADYLCHVGEGPCPVPVQPAGRTMRVRLTYYVEAGRTYSGGQTYAGSTACSWNFPIGTRFAFPDGEVFTCNDRGLLGSAGWLDLWRRPDLASRYGPYATVKVLP